MFTAYIWSIYNYGRGFWIFRMFNVYLPFGSKGYIRYGYSGFFDSLNKIYLRCGRDILGLKSSSYGRAVLVSLGWLSLMYRLLHIVVMWYLKVRGGLVDPTLVNHFIVLHTDDELWGLNTYYKHVDYLVNYLGDFIGVNLLELPPLIKIKPCLPEIERI